jgi:hypothetical protein
MIEPSLLVRVFVLAIALMTVGCATVRPIATSSHEWIAYRKTRVSPTLEGRLIAAARYLASYPDGAFVPQTRAFYQEAEPLYFELLRKSHDGLYTYLAALPRGPHADEARQILVLRAEKPRGPTGFDGGLMAIDAQIAAVAAQRTAAREEILNALRMWLDPKAFARPISEAKTTLVIPWSLSLPRARCSGIEDPKSEATRVCVKLLEKAYQATNGAALEERQATVEVAVSQDATGRPRKVVLGGPDLFVRLEETFGGRTIAPDDSRGRAAGVSRATEVVRREFGASVSDDPTCRKRPTGAAVMELRCNGIRVVVEAALDVANDDRIVIESVTGS